jgi:hypothetical protein
MMGTNPGPRRTSKFVKRFEVWFGGIFLTIGIGALLMGTVLFLVLGDDPEMGSRIWAFLLSPLTIGIIFTALGAVYLRRGLRHARKEERLLQVGATTEATVTAIEETNTRVKRRPLWRVHYVYNDLYGSAQKGQSGYLSGEEAQSYHIDEQVFVRYDPEQPAESIWLGHEERTEQF